jgi:hypothetical protein
VNVFFLVIPAKAGIHTAAPANATFMRAKRSTDPGFRREDDLLDGRTTAANRNSRRINR